MSDSKFSRRDLLGMSVGLSAYATMGNLLGAFPAFAQDTATVARKLVWINMSGGWDILESVDPKSASTAGLNIAYDWGLANPLRGATSDIRVGRWMPGLAANGADTVLVRGLAMGTTSHDAGSVYMDTGILSNNGTVNAASIPAIVASESTATIPLIQLQGGSTPLLDRGLLKPVSVVRAQNLDLYRQMYPTETALIAQRIKILDYLKTSVTRAQQISGVNDRLTALSAAETKIRGQIVDGIGAKLVLSAADTQPFSAAAAAAGATQGGADGAFALALKLIKNDLVTCINMGVGGFDTHSNQDRMLMPVLSSFDRSLKVFVDQLRAAGKLDTTLIVLFSDFGRTPRINNTSGRDHWPVGGAAIIGGGLAGGRAVGSTDANLLAVSANRETGEPEAGGTQLSPVHLGAAVVELTLGESYLGRRSYLERFPALTRLRS